MSRVFVHSTVSMDTVVAIQVVGHGEDAERRAERAAAVERAVDWFRHIEACCSRFDPASEVSRLASRIGVPVSASPILIEAVQFALALAEESGGAFDPTVGRRMAARGYDREYRTGRAVTTSIASAEGVSYRDVHVDTAAKTITLYRPLLLDLGAVVKGFAVDMAARELAPFENFAIDAGGDLYLGGRNAEDAPWSVGIRHPREEHALLETLHVSDTAVCTSGDYERVNPTSGQHIIDPRTGDPAMSSASVTVVAPVAMVADGLATAAFVLGPALGLELLNRHGVTGLIVTPALERFSTRDP